MNKYGLGMAAYLFNPGTQDTEVGAPLWDRGHPGLIASSKPAETTKEPCLKTNK